MNKKNSLLSLFFLFLCSSAVFAEEADVEKTAIIDDSNHTVFIDKIIYSLREQGGLVSVLSLDKSAHGSTLNWKSVFYLLVRSFYTASAEDCLLPGLAGGLLTRNLLLKLSEAAAIYAPCQTLST